ncbi:hypothetical protein AVEN_184023-1 [Araneus ventricosus]|uniref:Uncharacterized protein n=1 Tax=Araneus ventricosus TaxID=182803 RepID=A0A4Y2WA81_ARAVE|nr:hypothetical protein AVEN_184023-1 [Araneus ventricosus]
MLIGAVVSFACIQLSSSAKQQVSVDRNGLVVRCRPRIQRLPGSTPDSLKIHSVLGLLHVKSYVKVQASSLEKMAPDDRGSRLRSLFQNSPRFASKRDVNITKLF